MVNSLVVVLLVLLGARWYRKHDAVEEAPHGFAGIVEMLVTMIEDDIIKVCVGPDYKRYSPYLLTAFFFIFINNLMGIIPLFPVDGFVLPECFGQFLRHGNQFFIFKIFFVTFNDAH